MQNILRRYDEGASLVEKPTRIVIGDRKAPRANVFRRRRGSCKIPEETAKRPLFKKISRFADAGCKMRQLRAALGPFFK
jgi:hypothetical protein